MAQRPTFRMRGGKKWRRGLITTGAEASQEMAQRPTLRMLGGNKWLGGQHSVCAEATNGTEANIQNVRRQEVARRPQNNRRGGHDSYYITRSRYTYDMVICCNQWRWRMYLMANFC